MGRFSNRLREFDQNFRPMEVGQRPGLNNLEDGTYDFEILEVTLDETPQTHDLIMKWQLRVLGGPHAGYCCERPSFLNSQTNIDYLGADFKTLGFDVDSWLSFSDEVENALPKLAGKRFRGKKVTKGQYHNLYINELLGSSNPKLHQSGATEYREPAPGEPAPW